MMAYPLDYTQADLRPPKQRRRDRALVRRLWRDLVDIYGNRCLCCGAYDNLTKDHVIPTFLGGPNHLRNIQPLCRDCNHHKGHRTTDYRPSGWEPAVQRLLEALGEEGRW